MGLSATQIWQSTQGPLAPALAEEIPEIANITRVTYPQRILVQNGEVKFEERGYFVDSTFTEMFDFEFIAGDPEIALRELKNIVITTTLEEKYFPGQSALGQIITLRGREGKSGFTVTGVIKDPPTNSSLQFDFLINYLEYERTRPWMKHWGNYNLATYIQIDPRHTKSEVEEKIFDFIQTHKENSEKEELFLHSFKDSYLYSDFSGGREPTGRIQYVRMFSVIAVVILLIACINFMNLSTARSAKRAREVGIRKVSGAWRGFLIVQFIGESLFITILATVAGITLADLLLPVFNEITGKSITMPYTSGIFVSSLLAISVVTALIAGSYPAFYVSSFKPVQALSNRFQSKATMGGLRRVLVITQFTLAIVLIIFTVVIYQQIQFIQTKDLGINKDNVLQMPVYSSILDKQDVFDNLILDINGVSSLTYTNQNPIGIGNQTSDPTWPGKGEEQDFNFNVIQTDHQFVSTFDIQVVEGKNLPEEYNDKYNHFLVNEEAVRMMEVEDPIGMSLKFWDDNPGEIVGVVKDFHHQSLFSPIEPVIIKLNPTAAWQVMVRIDGHNTEATIAGIKTTFDQFEQEYPFEYQFVDDRFQRAYNSVTTVSKLANVFAFMAIFISCLGLFGLASFVTEQRTKETGIRKVMGATMSNLVLMFSKGFVILVLFSFLIAIPIAWFATDLWLSDFAYKISPGPMTFVVGGVLAIIIAVGTVSYQTIKAARANPIDSLRYE